MGFAGCWARTQRPPSFSGAEPGWCRAFVAHDLIAGAVREDEQVDAVAAQGVLGDHVARGNSYRSSRWFVDDSHAGISLSLDEVVPDLGIDGAVEGYSDGTICLAAGICRADVVVTDLSAVDAGIDEGAVAAVADIVVSHVCARGLDAEPDDVPGDVVVRDLDAAHVVHADADEPQLGRRDHGVAGDSGVRRAGREAPVLFAVDELVPSHPSVLSSDHRYVFAGEAADLGRVIWAPSRSTSFGFVGFWVFGFVCWVVLVCVWEGKKLE